LLWDPRDGESTEALFSYARQQSGRFFDPEAFANELTTGDAGIVRANLAYALLKDPGGQAVTPEDVFERASGYHLPTVEQVGITEDGLVWVVATNAENRMPNGRTFFGFETLEDDLRRDYRHAWSSHRVAGDRSLQIFMPSEYPFDQRIPERLTLTCQTEVYDRQREAPEIVGTVKLTDWQQGRKWPAEFMSGDFFPLVQAASHFLRQEDYESFDKVIAMLPGDPENDPEALDREQLRLSMLVKRQDHEAAVALGQRLMPLLEREYVSWKGARTSPRLFNDYLMALAAAGQIEKARETYRKVLELEPEIPDRLNRRARSDIRRQNKEDIDWNMLDLAHLFSSEARMTVDQISEFFGVDVKNDERFRDFHGWDWSWHYKDPVYASWFKHLNKLADHYDENPLPARMELVPRQEHEEFHAATEGIPGIDTHEVASLSRSLYAYVYEWNGELGNLVDMPKELQQVELDHDLIYRKGISLAEQQAFVLKQFGYEVDVVTEPRKVWVAHYDGRPLTPYKEVKAPVRHPGHGPYETGMAVAWGAVSMKNLLDNLMRYQPIELGYRLKIVDETGIKSTPEQKGNWASVAVSSENPTWSGEGGLEMAREWFEEQFGVTFSVTVHGFPVKQAGATARAGR